jgi:hypothetical protein
MRIFIYDLLRIFRNNVTRKSFPGRKSGRERNLPSGIDL